MTDQRSAKVSKPRRLKSPPTTTAASLMLHEAMAAFRQEMLAEDESDDDDPDDSIPKSKAYGDDYNLSASPPKARITAKFEMESDRPGQMTATVTRESQQSDGSWKATIRHESLPTVINPFTGKPTTFSTPKLRSQLAKRTPTAPDAVDKKWQALPTDTSSSSSSPQPRSLLNSSETPSRKPKTTWPPRSDSLNWKTKSNRITKLKPKVSPKSTHQQQQLRTSPRRRQQQPPSAPPPPPTRRKAPLPPPSPNAETHRSPNRVHNRRSTGRERVSR